MILNIGEVTTVQSASAATVIRIVRMERDTPGMEIVKAPCASVVTG
jgi:hypothetical protein